MLKKMYVINVNLFVTNKVFPATSVRVIKDDNVISNVPLVTV